MNDFDFIYLTIGRPTSGNEKDPAILKMKELMSLLEKEWQIISSAGVGQGVHYVLRRQKGIYDDKEVKK